MHTRKSLTLLPGVLALIAALVMPAKAEASGAPSGDDPIIIIGFVAIGVLAIAGTIAIVKTVDEIDQAIEDDEKKAKTSPTTTTTTKEASLKLSAIATPDGAFAAIGGRF